MSQPLALYRKYRPRSFDELIGQQHITQTLENALERDHISHAYLFTGPHGTGKTSSARLLAHRINGIDYKEEGTTYLDIIEIDAASNRRIEEIRNLRETIHVAPSELKYKVYIIDEVHMLTKEAFNALLKTLEEPPAHAVFILATTEAHKVPSTIISRTQRHNFKPVQAEDIIRHLKTLAEKETITIDEESLSLLAEHGRGSVRDTVSLLDQAATINNGQITSDDVVGMLGLVQSTTLTSLSESLAQGRLGEVFQLLEELQDRGVTSTAIAQQLASLWRKQLRNNSLGISLEDVRRILGIMTHHMPDTELELVLAQIAARHGAEPVSRPVVSAPAPKATQPVETRPSTPDTPLAQKPVKVTPTEPEAPKVEKITYKELTSVDDSLLKKWPEVVEAARHKSHSLFSSLRQAQPRLQDGALDIVFKFQLHCKKVQQPAIRSDLESVLDSVYGGVPTFTCSVGAVTDTTIKAATKPPASAPPKADKDIQKVTDIFGGDVISLGNA